METAAGFSNAAATTTLAGLRNGGQLSRSSHLKTPFSFFPPTNKLRLNSVNTPLTFGRTSIAQAVNLDSAISVPSGTVELDWDNLGFGLVNTDYMYIMKCSLGDTFSKGELVPFGNIEINPSAGVLNYGQGLFEGLKAYRTKDGNILLFRPEENAKRMIAGAERMCMPSPSVDQFLQAVKSTVLANEKWIPPPGKGSLHIRPMLMGSGSVLGLAPAPEYTFLIYVSPVGNYFKVDKYLHFCWEIL